VRDKVKTTQFAIRFAFVGTIVIYHFLYAIWKRQLVLLEDMGPSPIDFLLFASALLLLVGNRWINRVLLALNISGLIFHVCFVLVTNCRDEVLTSSLIKCGWFSWENIWLPWWIMYWCLQIVLIGYLLVQERNILKQGSMV